jgi:small subunit ribosomal protein S16
MLTIRLQRTGRKGHAQFRVVVQDARRTPTSGRVVAALGHFDPHAKTTVINKEKAAYYLEHGAQPSDRVARLLKAEGVKLPKWVKLSSAKQGVTRNAEKLRKNRPASAETADKPAEEVAPEEAPAADEAPTEEPAKAPAEEKTTEGEAPTEETAASEADKAKVKPAEK